LSVGKTMQTIVHNADSAKFVPVHSTEYLTLESSINNLIT